MFCYSVFDVYKKPENSIKIAPVLICLLSFWYGQNIVSVVEFWLFTTDVQYIIIERLVTQNCKELR